MNPTKWMSWLRKGFIALIGGGVNSVATTFMAMQIAPQTFNTLSDWNTGQVCKLAVANFVVGAVLALNNFIKETPPPEE